MQFVISVIGGIIFAGLVRFFERETMVVGFYWMSGIIQTLIRGLFVYIVFIKFYGYKFKDQTKVLLNTLLPSVFLYLLLVLLRLVLSGMVLQISQIVWEIICVMFFIVYFGENMRVQTKNQ